MNLFIILFIILNGFRTLFELDNLPINSEIKAIYAYNKLMKFNYPKLKYFKRVYNALKEHYRRYPLVVSGYGNYKIRGTEMFVTNIVLNDDVSLFQRFTKTPYAVHYFQGNQNFKSDFSYTPVLHQNLKKIINTAIEKKSHSLLQHLVENLVDVVPIKFYLPLSYQILEYLETHSSWYRSYQKEKDYTTSSNKFLNQGSLTTNNILRGGFHPESKLPLRLHQLAELSKTNETVLEHIKTNGESWIPDCFEGFFN
jgi:hypothetical protein